MASIPVPSACRTCVHFVSTAEALARGVGGICDNPASPAAWTEVIWRDSCREHDPVHYDNLGRVAHVLGERECLNCGHVNLYSLGYERELWCARCGTV